MIGAIGTAIKTATNAAVNAAKKKSTVTPATPKAPTKSSNNLLGNMINMGAQMATDVAKSNAKPQQQSNQDIYQSYLGGNGNEHMDYINKNYAGGMNAYLQTQQNKYNSALASGDTDMLNRLSADSQRVGYQLQIPQQQMQQIPQMQQQQMPELNLPEYKPFNYQDFSYDVNKDNIYKQYAEQFARQGKSAGEQALADSAATTGGMASSYANAANSQMQQAYAKKTADMVPVLEQQAYDKYLNERNFSYQDYLNNYNNDRDNALQAYQDKWKNREYSDSRGDVAYNRNFDKEKFDYGKYFDETNRKDKLAQNTFENTYKQKYFDWDVSKSNKEFDYNKYQDSITNSINKDSNSLRWANYSLDKQNSASHNDIELQKFQHEKQQSELKYAKDTESTKIETKNKEMTNFKIKDFVSEALKSNNPQKYFADNSNGLLADEIPIVLEILNKYSGLNKKNK